MKVIDVREPTAPFITGSSDALLFTNKLSLSDMQDFAVVFDEKGLRIIELLKVKVDFSVTDKLSTSNKSIY